MSSLSACLTCYFPFCFHCFTYSLSSSFAWFLSFFFSHLTFIFCFHFLSFCLIFLLFLSILPHHPISQLVHHLYFIYFHVAYPIIPICLSFSSSKCASASTSSPSTLYLTVSLLCLPPISISSSSYSNPIHCFMFSVHCGFLSLTTLLFFTVF
ncbi:uncharacterized protein EV420DRAFT_1546647 [Desarmillaria tabescens]|uniref:Uncharacterized protein n=1 Tax=Armillaria tabescens TaxID=1929756 RepID=A0AA39N4S6_ARMTA|nr:uncharacterized protein EV420DRAFT_1546647 [Desarmillaria tabescens]KAK0458131.1 hypothetical protein EV420DRAFT_1546647 [Desarmillaria tabescens]